MSSSSSFLPLSSTGKRKREEEDAKEVKKPKKPKAAHLELPQEGDLTFFSKSASDVGRFLSNFYPSPVTLHDHTFATVEHAFQAHKWLFLTGMKDVKTFTSFT